MSQEPDDLSDIQRDEAYEDAHRRLRRTKSGQWRRQVPLTRTTRGTWAQMGIAAVVFAGLYRVTPERFIATGSSPAGVLTLALLGVLSVAISVLVWMGLGRKKRDLLRRLVILAPVVLVSWCFVAIVSEGAGRAGSLDPEGVAGTSRSEAARLPTAGAREPGRSRGASEPVQFARFAELGASDTLAIGYEVDGVRIRSEVWLAEGNTPEDVAAAFEKLFRSNNWPMTAVTIGGRGAVEVSPDDSFPATGSWWLSSQTDALPVP